MEILYFIFGNIYIYIYIIGVDFWSDNTIFASKFELILLYFFITLSMMKEA